MNEIETIKDVIINSDNETEFTNYEKCKQCFKKYGRTCCTEFPCEINASDLVDITEDNIRKLLFTGLVVIDRWDDNVVDDTKFQLPTTLYLRMRGKKDSKCFDFGWNFYGNKCMCLGDNGCKLSFSHRPYYGRKFDCDTFPREELCSGKFDAAKSWLPYQDLLDKIWDEILDEIIE